MSITGKQLYDKVRGLRPDLSSGITSEILSKACDDPSVQPFLKWFCKNVSDANILSDEEIKLKNAAHEAGEWLEGEALDAALEEATKDCPDLLRLVDSLDDKEDLLAEYEELQESCREDEEYLHLLKHSMKNLKEVENKLDDDIEEAETMLDRERIETEKAYDDCSMILKEFDRDNCQFSKDVEILLNVYANAFKNQGNAILWSQMPTDLFVKQVELYNHYLEIHVRKQFGNANKEEQNEDSDYTSLMNDSREKQVHEKMHELALCKANLTDSKVQEISAASREESLVVMLQCVQDIYNDGSLKVPKDIQLQDEMRALRMKRDFLEQSVEVLRDQQIPEVTHFAEMEILRILKNDALARLERRKARLEKLKTLFSLAGKHGHVHVDLLCVLMEMQRRCLHEIVEFVADARHYIATEYKLSSTRCQIMQQLQDEYATLVTRSPDTHVFNQIFVAMMLGSDPLDGSLSSALKKYDDLLADNAEKKKSILETYLNNKVGELKRLENEADKDYLAEIQTGPTISLKPISYEISSKCEEISALVRELQDDITRIRSQFKERMRMDANLEREKDILWQRFLADPDTLRTKYEEAKQKANESHFGDSSEGKPSS
ncbi:hypothetical protein DMN91_003715 [Ooceraea biroi]|uniref:HAUS augmin-like complex subunit 3 N-terminal domain-containing protein n=1 Tax=Ooceraea biroi TaxID=2015173 RepID=A0A026W3P7_OOCBI|nr:augmin complex subunit dgt3 [Ooceraea biroi]EZA50682.1 hypothetical protein X777_11033 [Ooceraea biroi]RLU23510.1 hypothetical protein DMN91_003715 [Ooceraea biroi]